MVVKDGRFGPYVTDGETNASLRRGDEPETLTVERAAELLADRRARGPATTRRRPARRRRVPSRAADFGRDRRSGRAAHQAGDQQPQANPDQASSSAPMLRSAARPATRRRSSLPRSASVLRLPVERLLTGSRGRGRPEVLLGRERAAAAAPCRRLAVVVDVGHDGALPVAEVGLLSARAMPTKTGRSLSLRIRTVPRKSSAAQSAPRRRRRRSPDDRVGRRLEVPVGVIRKPSSSRWTRSTTTTAHPPTSSRNASSAAMLPSTSSTAPPPRAPPREPRVGCPLPPPHRPCRRAPALPAPGHRLLAALVEPERRIAVGHQPAYAATRSTQRSRPSTKSKIPGG